MIKFNVLAHDGYRTYGGLGMKKITKRQRKAKKGPNAAVKYSLDKGDLIHSAGTAYSGRPPLFSIDLKGGFIRTAKGIPFVRVTME